MTRLTEAAVFTADNKPTLALSERAHHSRMDNALHRWVDDFTPGANPSIIVGVSTLEYDLVADEVVYVNQIQAALETVSDDCHVHLMAYNTTGGWTQMTGAMHIFSGGTLLGSERDIQFYNPPVKIAYSDGYRRIGFQFDANDAGAVVSAFWCGWTESDA